MAKKGKKKESGGLTRVAIVNGDRCKPNKCNQECKRFCPVVRMGKRCVEVSAKAKVSFISETLCNGCGICVQKCPFDSITIINLPKSLDTQVTHRYGPNTFKLHRLPVPRPGQVLGLVGTNGIGKSTALKILAARIQPNLGKFDETPAWADILTHFRGSELQNYFTKMLQDDIRAAIKPQYVDQIPRAVKGEVGNLLESRAIDDSVLDFQADLLELTHIMDRQIKVLSGGELQRFALAITAVQDADIYMFDEPSSYLDIKQRLNASLAIRTVLEGNQSRYVIVVEHDLAILDYMSDYVCCLYGKPGAYGVVTMPYSVREGINVFLAGFIPTENLRFRDSALTFKVAEHADEEIVAGRLHNTKYPEMVKTMGDFTLNVESGEFSDTEIVVLLGQNGCGKTTLIRLMAGLILPDDEDIYVPRMHISYKPQKIAPKFKGSVRQLLARKVNAMMHHPQFASDVLKPLLIEPLLDQMVQNLSGGELQRVAITLCLGVQADMYLIDEPSAYLDSEQRIFAGKVIRRFILHSNKTAFVVEHDMVMSTYLADRVIVYNGTPGVECTASPPETLLSGMNTFLKMLEVTFRRDPTNFRPRLNKKYSVKDQEQKASGHYFFLDTPVNDDD